MFPIMNKKLFSLAIFAFLLGLFAEKTNAQASGVKPELIMYRHNGGGITPAPVAPTNIIGTLKWNGLTAIGSIMTGASIRSVAKQVSPGLLRADMTFSTSGNDRAIITEDGLVGIGILSPVYHLDVLGNTHTSGRFYGRIHFDLGEPTDLPNSYFDEAYFERKSRAQLGLAASTYSNGGILSLAPGGGSLDRQLFSGGDDGLWTRSQDASGANSWAAWEKILTSGDINGRTNLVARFLPPGPSSSKLGDSQLFDNGANVVVGGIPAGPNPVPAFVASDMFTVNGDSRATGNSAVNGSLTVGTTANVSGLATVNSLSVTTNATLNGNVGIGKIPSAFDLDVAGESNFDGRVKIGANAFPIFAGAAGFELAVGGGIVAEEVVVDLQPWADYVFESDYELKSLSEVENFIQKEKHLPGVSSAKEIAENGLNLGEMQKTQMEKIEELYLHVIEMNKQLQTLKTENEALKTKVDQLEKR